MLNFKKLAAVAAIIFAGALASSEAATAVWNFTDGDAVVDSSNFTNLVNVPTLDRGNNNGTTVLINSTSASSGYAGASGTNNAGAAARTGALDVTMSAYFEFTLAPDAGFAVTGTGLTLGTRSTSTGPQLLTLRSSLDGFVGNLATVVVSNTGAWQFVDFGVFNATGGGGEPVTFRIYGSNGTGAAAANTANWRIDDITFSGEVVVIPEPATYMLFGIGLLACAQRFRRAKKK
jgi:hypothetical protein